MRFLAPAWLLAALAVVIPIVYHLRRNTPPDVILVGSVADLATGAASADRRRPRDLPLLLLRCLLLLVVAGALAAPNWSRDRAGRRIVVAPRGHDAVAESLLATGAIRIAPPSSAFPWGEAQRLAASLSPDDTLLLVAPDDAARWRGPRPTLPSLAIAVGAVGDDSSRPGPPLTERATARGDRPADAPRDRPATALWWLALFLAPIERAVARRHPDAG